MSNENQEFQEEQQSQEDQAHEEQQSEGVDPEIEAEAREMGWNPERFKGTDKWVSAEDFIERGKAINPILRKNNERLKAEIAAEREELKKLKLTVTEFQKEFSKMKENAYQRALRDLKAQRKEARADGDWDTVEALEEQIEETKAQAEKIKQPETQETKTPEPTKVSEVFQEWHQENKWFNESKEPDMFDTAEGYAIRLRRENPTLGEEEFLQKVTAHIKKKFPEKFENPNREKGSSVGGGSSRGESSGGKKSYASLPADAKKACDNFVEAKLMTREQYVAEYFGE